MNKKTVYITPEITVTGLDAGNILAGASKEDFTNPENSDAKENSVVEEETLPTKPNLWGDDEE